MSVTNTNKQYDGNQSKWKRCRDVVAGRDAVIINGRLTQRNIGSLYTAQSLNDVYLPRLSGQSETEYLAYAERAGFFNATGRTIDAMTGLIFAKDPSWQLPTAIEAYEDDITLSATNLREFSEQVVEQQVAIGRVGIMVDFPEVTLFNMSVADAERMNVRPFLRLYTAENIINWRTGVVNGVRVLTLVVLRENIEQAKDEFTTEDITQYRVLDLTPEGYRVRLMNDKSELQQEWFPKMRGAAMLEIPFSILGANSCDAEVQKPPLLDLVDTNLAHYRNSADYEHGLHFTGLPTPYVAGVQLSEGQVLSIGSMSAWVFPDPAANVGFLEFKGDGLKTLAEAIKAKEQRMAVLGARMLSDDRKSNEAFGTIELRTAGERSVLASIARAASDAIRKSLNTMAEWVGAPAEAEFALNTDFGASRMQPQMLTALVGAYQSGAIPMSVMFDNLQRGEIVNPDMEFEDYQAKIEDEGPNLSMPTNAGQPIDPNTGQPIDPNNNDNAQQPDTQQ
jgi:hypothetical protein